MNKVRRDGRGMAAAALKVGSAYWEWASKSQLGYALAMRRWLALSRDYLGLRDAADFARAYPSHPSQLNPVISERR